MSRRESVSRPVPGSAVALFVLGLACIAAGAVAGATVAGATGTYVGRGFAVAALVLIGLAWIVARVGSRR